MTGADPRFVEVTRVDDALRGGLVDCWVAVTDAGGAVGFLPPAERPVIEEALQHALEPVELGRRWLGVVREGDEVAGFGFVTPQSGPVVGHRASVTSLQIHPDRQGRGIGRLLLEGLHDLARARGTTQLTLFFRSGLGLSDFYRALGYREAGRWSATLHVSDTDWRDEIWMVRDL